MKLSNYYRNGFTFIVSLILIGPICSVSSDSLSQPLYGQVDRKLIDRQTELITSGFSSVFWNYIRRPEQSLNHVSIECLKSLNTVLQSTLTGQPWAFKFVSASGSMPNHFLDGSYSAFGSYDSCLELSEVVRDTKLSSQDTKDDQSIKGQYCLTSLEPDTIKAGQSEGQFLKKLYQHHFDSQFNLSIKVGLCVPSTCSKDDVEQLMSQALYDYSWRLIDVNSCEVDRTIFQRLESANRGQLICLWFIGSLIATIVWGTYLDIKSSSSDDKSSHLFWIKQFSVFKSVQSLLREPSKSPKLLVADKIRFTSYITSIHLHAFMWFALINASFLMDQTRKGLELFNRLEYQPFANDWMFEGLIYLGGVIAGISLLSKMGPETSFTVYLKEIIQRAIIVLPPLLVLISFEVILSLFGSGPIFNSINSARSAICIKNFLYNIFHIQNNCSPLEICASQTWSIAVEWQLFILLSIAVYIYKRNYRLGVTFNIFMIFIGFYMVHRVIFRDNVKLFVVMPTETTLRELAYNRISSYYISTEAHIWSYFHGLLVVVILIGNYESRLGAIVGRLRVKILIVLGVLLSYSSAPWNVFGMEVNPTHMILASILTKIASITWLSLLILGSGKSVRKFFSNSKIKGMYIYKDEPDVENEDNQMARYNNNTIKSGTKSELNSDLSPIKKNKKLHYFIIVMRLLRATYFSHSIIFTWYFTSLRSPYPFSYIHCIMVTITLDILALAGGFVFHILIIGPIEAIYYTIRTGSLKSKIN